MLKICALNESGSETDSDFEQVKQSVEILFILNQISFYLGSSWDQGSSGSCSAGSLQLWSQTDDWEQEIWS